MSAANKRNYWVNMDLVLEKEPLLLPEDDTEDDTEDNKMDAQHVLSEIVDTVMKTSNDILLRYINREELTKVISNLHSHQQHAFSSNNFIVLKKYEDYIDENKENEEGKSKHECKYDYGVFKNRHMDLIFRVDCVEDQVDNEKKIAQILLKKYNNNYKDVAQMGIVLPL